jgi:hypothetical protein
MFRTKTIALLMLIVTGGCSTYGCIEDEHRRLCHRDMKIIVYDTKVWQEYVAFAKIGYIADQKERQARLNNTIRLYGGTGVGVEPVGESQALVIPMGGYDVVYGESQSAGRDVPRDEIVRNDILITKNLRVFARVVDYVVLFSAIDSDVFRTCSGYGPAHKYKNVVFVKEGGELR